MWQPNVHVLTFDLYYYFSTLTAEIAVSLSLCFVLFFHILDKEVGRVR